MVALATGPTKELKVPSLATGCTKELKGLEVAHH